MFASTLSGSNCPSKVQHIAFGIRCAMCWAEPPLLHAPSSRCRTPQELWGSEVWAPKSAMPTSKMANHAKRGWKDSHFEILRDPSPFCFSSSHKWVLLILILPFQIHSLPWKTTELGQCNFQKHCWKAAYFKNTWKKLKKTCHFSEIRHLGFWRKQRFQEKTKGKSVQQLQRSESESTPPCRVTKWHLLHELKMRTRLHVFFKS